MDKQLSGGLLLNFVAPGFGHNLLRGKEKGMNHPVRISSHYCPSLQLSDELRRRSLRYIVILILWKCLSIRLMK